MGLGDLIAISSPFSEDLFTMKYVPFTKIKPKRPESTTKCLMTCMKTASLLDNFGHGSGTFKFNNLEITLVVSVKAPANDSILLKDPRS